MTDIADCPRAAQAIRSRRAQARWYRFWEQQGYFHSEPDPSRKPVHDRHPAAERHRRLHLGHALNNTLQDILIR